MSKPSRAGYAPLTIMRLWPQAYTDESLFDELLAMFLRHRAACDEIWFCTLTSYPTLDQHSACAEMMSRAASKTRDSGILSGIQISNTIGHRDHPGSNTEGVSFRPIISHDGTACEMCFCPRCDRLREYYRQIARMYAQWQPSSVWIDDDLRMHHHVPIEFPCFCDACLEAFSGKTGRAWDREGLVTALNESDGGDLRLAWVRSNEEALADFAGMIAETVHEVAPEARMALQYCGIEWSLYSGWGAIEIFERMHAATGMPVACRPGEGVYADHEPRRLVQKAQFICRTIAEMPNCVDFMTAEIENSPHVARGKSPHGTAVEASLDLAMGCDGVSFAIFGVHEPQSSYERIVERIASYRPFWEEFQRASNGTAPGGLAVLLSRTHVGRTMEPDEAPFSWAAVDLSEVYQMAHIGVPLCAGRSRACGAILHGDTAWGFTDEELADILTGPVVMDGRAAYRIQQRGLEELLGVSVARFSRRGCMERLSEDPLNGRYQGHAGRSSGQGGRGGDYVVEPGQGDVRILGHYVGRNGTQQGISAIVASNAQGGRIAVFGRSPWKTIVGEALHRRFLATADWVCSGRLPVMLETAAQVVIVPRVGPGGQLRSVFLLNVSIDRTPPLSLRLRGFAGSAARWHVPDGPGAGISLAETSDGLVAELPPLQPWSVGFLAAYNKAPL